MTLSDDDPSEANTEELKLRQAFETGTLREIEGEFIPCDYITPMIGAILGSFIGGVLPLGSLILCFGSTLIFNPSWYSNLYAKVLEADLITQSVTLVIILFVIGLTGWLFSVGWPPFWMAILGLCEYCREKKTQQYRYGLCLTQNSLGLRCHSKRVSTLPLILSRDEISQFFLGSEYSEASHQRTPFILVQYQKIDASPQKIRLPSAHLQPSIHKLYSRLTEWHGNKKHGD